MYNAFGGPPQVHLLCTTFFILIIMRGKVLPATLILPHNGRLCGLYCHIAGNTLLNQWKQFLILLVILGYPRLVTVVFNAHFLKGFKKKYWFVTV